MLSAVHPVGAISRSTGDTMQALVSTDVELTVGVDTHADVHVAAALDQLGRLVETHSVADHPGGFP